MTDNTCVMINENQPDIQANSVMRFLFEEHGVRGEIMHLQTPSAKLLEFHNYPESVNHLMLDLAGAAVLMAATLKAEGLVTMQIMGGKGEHALRYAFVNIDKDLTFYGSAGLLEGVDYSGDLSLKDLAGEGGVLVFSVMPEDGSRYQSMVSLDKDNLAQALEDYFKESEQLPTRFKLFHNIQDLTVSGIMLQIIPNIEGNLESLDHLSTLADSMTEEELTKLSLHECVRRLYWNDKVRVFDPVKVAFKCTCSKERYLDTIKNMPIADVRDLAEDKDGLILTCNNCGCVYHVSYQEMQEILKQKEQAMEENTKAVTEQDNVQSPEQTAKNEASETAKEPAVSQRKTDNGAPLKHDGEDCVVLSEN